MNQRHVKVAIYYRTFPAAVEREVVRDKFLSYKKDGMHPHGSLKTPRMTVTIAHEGVQADKKRVSRLLALLDNLLQNNQIVDYKIRR